MMNAHKSFIIRYSPVQRFLQWFEQPRIGDVGGSDQENDTGCAVEYLDDAWRKEPFEPIGVISQGRFGSEHTHQGSNHKPVLLGIGVVQVRANIRHYSYPGHKIDRVERVQKKAGREVIHEITKPGFGIGQPGRSFQDIDQTQGNQKDNAHYRHQILEPLRLWDKGRSQQSRCNKQNIADNNAKNDFHPRPKSVVDTILNQGKKHRPERQAKGGTQQKTKEYRKKQNQFTVCGL